MTVARNWLALAGATMLAMQPTVAAAQDCLAEDEVSAMAIYAMPGVVQGVKQRCATRLATGGFLARGGAALSARYARLQAGAWPKAKTGLLKIAANKAGAPRANGRAGAGASGNLGSLQVIASLPDSAVRPLVDALIVQEVTPEIDVNQCGKIELLMQALNKVEPEIAGTLLGLIAGLVKLDQAPICGVRA
ncbi:MAG: hypothetical protein WA842_10100 [Croceibacterium sp.]